VAFFTGQLPDEAVSDFDEKGLCETEESLIKNISPHRGAAA
jgi:hypothetical protein